MRQDVRFCYWNNLAIVFQKVFVQFVDPVSYIKKKYLYCLKNTTVKIHPNPPIYDTLKLMEFRSFPELKTNRRFFSAKLLLNFIKLKVSLKASFGLYKHRVFTVVLFKAQKKRLLSEQEQGTFQILKNVTFCK